MRALRAEQLKFKFGKSTLMVLKQLAKEVRDLELQMSSTAAERVAVHVRFGFFARDLENQATTELERVMTRQWREEADSDLLRAKRDLK